MSDYADENYQHWKRHHSIFSKYISRSGFLDSTVFFFFFLTPILFWWWWFLFFAVAAVPVYISTDSVQGPYIPTPTPPLKKGLGLLVVSLDFKG